MGNRQSAMSCPACESPTLKPFYEVDSIPTQSNLLMATREIAIAQPRGDLMLAVCEHCGFITNTAFDPATQELTGKYEATQGHSPTFSAFAKKLAQRWVDRYHLAGKNVLEIGCGQGEFISGLCDTANTPGIGIDPILSPDRKTDGRHVSFISDYYGPQYRNLPADFIFCRHTLEHIHKPLEFLRTIRAAVGNNTRAVVAFEVPDTLRVLRECAFWDMYFEHCSYFVPETLQGTFERAGFEVLDQYKEFDDQYLVIDVKPATPKSTPLVWDAKDEIARFKSNCSTSLKLWQSRFEVWKSRGAKVAVWGSGSKAVGFLTTLHITDQVVPFVVDINPNKHNTYLPGTAQKIVAPSALVDYKPDVVIVMNPIYVPEITADLHSMNLHPTVEALTGVQLHL
ncbi:class I SAM-dependent methyltransferase [soil metagenome]